ncbi:MAG: cupin domain-containing protein [Clostridia bacterium]|nr:cupin domain-containing protein [Clostridia bacterium]
MKIVRGNDVENALEHGVRVYLCGQLSQKNEYLDHIENDGYEIGISQYDEYTFEKPHIHTSNTEYNYVLEGSIKILLIREGKELCFSKGDLFVIETGEPYVGKAMAGSRTIFSKVPGGNDKELYPMDEKILAWGASWDSVYEE